MLANLPLNEMSLEEKLQAMEALWDDLSREPDRIESPSWHEHVLKETQRRVESGQATFSDWEKAKGSIRDRLK
jgi:Putative addiction module component